MIVLLKKTCAVGRLCQDTQQENAHLRHFKKQSELNSGSDILQSAQMVTRKLQVRQVVASEASVDPKFHTKCLVVSLFHTLLSILYEEKV